MTTNAKTKTDAEAWLDDLDSAATPAKDARHLREIDALRDRIADAEGQLRVAVRAARDDGDSWSAVGLALRTSRQAAFQRFSGVDSDDEAIVSVEPLESAPDFSEGDGVLHATLVQPHGTPGDEAPGSVKQRWTAALVSFNEAVARLREAMPEVADGIILDSATAGIDKPIVSATSTWSAVRLLALDLGNAVEHNDHRKLDRIAQELSIIVGTEERHGDVNSGLREPIKVLPERRSHRTAG